MEVLTGDPPCRPCLDALELADEYAANYVGRLKVIKLAGKEARAKFVHYKLDCTPAIVINGTIRIEGICPSRATLDSALKEAGL